MLNIETPQMYDAVQTLNQLDLKKQPSVQQQAIIGQITLTAMASSIPNGVNASNLGATTNSTTNSTTTGSSSNNNNNNNHNSSNNNNNNPTQNVQNQTQQQQHHHQQHQQPQQPPPQPPANTIGLIVKQNAMHQMHNAAAALNNNNNSNNNNNNNHNSNNNTSVLNANNVNNVNNLLQKQMLHQYVQSDLDELTAQEISLDLQHLIDDQFRDQETLGIFSDMVTSPAVLSATLPPNGVVSAAAKVLQQHQQLQQQTLRTQHQNYARNPLVYMPQSIHGGGGSGGGGGGGSAYSTHSSDENSSIGSDTSTIKEEPIDPDYRRHLHENQNTVAVNNPSTAAFITSNGSMANALYNPYQHSNTNGSIGSGNTVLSQTNPTNFNAINANNVLNHHNGVNLPPHLAAGAHLLKHHNKQLQNHRKTAMKHIDKGTEEYRRRRERNNIAVRKSREKAKVRSREVEERVKTLLKEKEALLRQLQEMTNELQLHKQVYMQLMNHTNPEVSRVCRSFLNTSNDHGL